MTRRSPIYYSDSQKALMWERWKAGDTLHQIAHLFDRSHSSINRILADTGGIRPALRRRSRLALTLVEREEVSHCLVAGLSIRTIADRLGRAPSTVSREINRNGGESSYRATQADMEAAASASAQALQAGGAPSPGCDRHRQAADAVVTRADRGVVKEYLPRRPEPPRVTRNDLPQPVHPSSRRSEARAAAALAAYPRHAAF
jgi:DNA-binding CsgD family transcriptional regulator